VSVYADAGIIPTMYSGSEPTADVALQTDFQVVLFGATGPGLFDPCLRVSTSGVGAQSGQISFGGTNLLSIGGGQTSGCTLNPVTDGIPFVFGQPFNVHGFFEAQAGATVPGLSTFVTTSAEFDGGSALVLNTGQTISTTTGSILIIPEPAGALLVLLPLAFFFATRQWP
jgi:hypothetical protein